MRYLVLSDIHGGRDALSRALGFFERFECDMIVLLGDILNHGPRNRVPDDYDPPAVAEQLNAYSDRIIAIRGNCDSEVDGMMLSFHLDAPYAYVDVKSEEGVIRRVMLTHGHLYALSDPDEEKSEKIRRSHGLRENDVVLSGHTHVAGVFRHDNGIVNVNPGSTTIPKGGTAAGFALLDDVKGEIGLFDLEGREVGSHRLFDGS